MHNEIRISEGLFYVGGSDRRISLFENVYPLSNGISYNSYLYLDEKTLLLDTVDHAISDVFFENLDYLLQGRDLDYLIIDHMEPDHAATIADLLRLHPEVTIVCSAMAKKFFANYFPTIETGFQLIKEGDVLSIGKHEFTFFTAPMVHWPEVMFTFEKSEGILYSADAFGTFGALNGDVFAQKRNFDIDEARRYYANIVGKYGTQVNAALKKIEGLDVRIIAPLHGPLHKDIKPLVDLYKTWADYEPEDKESVMIAYSSVYGHTANAAEIIAKKLVEKGVKDIVIYDVSKTDCSVLVSEAFRVHTIVLAATTYNAGVFVKMEDFLHDLANHKIKNRTIALVENGSWAPAAKANMLKILDGLEGILYIDETMTIAASLREAQLEKIDQIVSGIVDDLSGKGSAKAKEKKTAWRCKICGHVVVMDELPSDFVCPLCKHPASDFEKIEI